MSTYQIIYRTSDAAGNPADADATPTITVTNPTTGVGIVAALTSMDHDDTGVYSYTLTYGAAEAADTIIDDQTYQYVVNYDFGGTAIEVTDAFDSETPAIGLITLARAKRAFAVPPAAYDSTLQELILAASAAIERHCNRQFASATFDELYDGPGGFTLLLNQFPIIDVLRIAACPDAVMTVMNSDDGTNSRASVRVTSTGVTLTRVAAGIESSSSVTFAAAATLTALAAAINALGSSWSAEVSTEYAGWPSADLLPMGPKPCLAAWVGLDAMTDELTQDGQDLMMGLVACSEGFAAGRQNIRVKYTAGYATVPEDVQQACAMAVADAFHRLERDGNLNSERLGDYSFSAGEGRAFLTPDVRSILARYRDHVV